MTLARERLEATLERIASVGDRAIFTRLYTASARAAADAADARRAQGATLGPLDGALVSIKDLFDVAGEATAAGSAMLSDAPAATADAQVVARLRAAGVVIVGKTNMTEFAYSGLGLNPYGGTPCNARDPARVPGGSSSGAGVSVALGLVDVAIGSDTGGSVRIPAALNGVCGFKPTASRLPLRGVFPLSPSLDAVGPLAGSIQACADADTVTADAPPRALALRPLRGVTFAVIDEHLEDCDAIVTLAFDRAVASLRRAGAEVRRAHLGDLIAEMRAILTEAPIVPFEAAQIHAGRLVSSRALFDPNVLKRILRGTEIDPADYRVSVARRARLIRAMDARAANWDALLAPTTPIVAPLLAQMDDHARYDHANALVLRNTGFANFFDLCSLSLPIPGTTLSVGLLITGRHDRDCQILSIGRSVELNSHKL
jgi:aspartyl-tRNA(Asn)/glutamyl-tRNA(Gln) amidotransferase subunit A